jgi:hypothetical protein
MRHQDLFWGKHGKSNVAYVQVYHAVHVLKVKRKGLADSCSSVIVLNCVKLIIHDSDALIHWENK